MAELEFALAIIGAGTVLIVAVALAAFVACTLRGHRRYGRWWWDETADALEANGE